jgi:hypothetical protein
MFGEPFQASCQHVQPYETFDVDPAEEQSKGFQNLVASGEVTRAPAYDAGDIRTLPAHERFITLVRNSPPPPGFADVDPGAVERIVRHFVDTHGARLGWDPTAKSMADGNHGIVTCRYTKRVEFDQRDSNKFAKAREYLTALARAYEARHGNHSLGFSRPA